MAAKRKVVAAIEPKKVWLVVKRTENGEVVQRIDVTGKTERQIEKVEDGLMINMNHDRFYLDRE